MATVAILLFLLTRIIPVITVNSSSRYPWLEQIMRQEQLISNCNHHHQLAERTTVNVSNLDHMLVDHKHRLLYCYVPKVACTNWKRMLMALTGVTTHTSNLIEIPGDVAHADNSTIRLTQLSEAHALDCLHTYTNFLMVRHPFERLLSAYRNKFEDTYSHYFQMRYGRYIMKKYRPTASETDLQTGANVTFREFVLFLLDEGLQWNEHWRPIYDLCAPCLVNYTFIGRYETLLDDADGLLDLIGASAPYIKFPLTRQANTSNRLRYYFQQLSIGEIRELYRVYAMDFKLFDYNVENLLGFDLD